MFSRSATSPVALAVNPGSPRVFDRQGAASLQSPRPPSPDSQASRTPASDSGSDPKRDAAVRRQSSQLRFTIDPEGHLTHDETTVDVVAVPCPGGHPLRSWSRDGLMGRYYGALSMRDAQVKDDSERPAPSWVRQGIRREADKARILLYEHPQIEEDTTLSALADGLLHNLQHLRENEHDERPVVFVGHSVGGLVVKMALVKAGRDARYENILRQCYGVAFFGSSYFSLPSLACSIQNLLQLSSPLPASVTDDLRVGNSLLIRADEDFKAVSNDLQVWTFYETIDSRLPGGSATSASESREVYFTAPLASMSSAILGMRQERIFPLQSDHANIASFGRHNVRTLHMFLKQLAHQIGHADANVRAEKFGGQWRLGLEHKVNVEVHGFFDGPPPSQGQLEGDGCPIVRAWSTRLPLREFLSKGPDGCLSERLNEVEASPEGGRLLGRGGRTPLAQEGSEIAPVPAAAADPTTVKNALGIQDAVSRTGAATSPVSPKVRPLDAGSPGTRPGPVATPLGPTIPPSRGISPRSSPLGRSPPLVRADIDQDLAVDRLSPPLRGRLGGRSISRSFSLGSDGSRFEYKDFPPFSPRSRSSIGDVLGSDDEDLDSPRLPEAVVAIRKLTNTGTGDASEVVIVDQAPMAFVKPDVESRKFLWVHVPFNNPTWVKSVLQSLEASYKKDYSALYGQDFWMTRHTRGRHAQHYAHYAKPGCYFSAPRTLSPRGRSMGGNQSLSPPLGNGDSSYICLFLPYLHFDSYKKLLRRRNTIIRRLSQGRAQPVPETVAKSDSLELQVIWEYLGHDPPINCRRTLDQYGYPSLRDTRSRDDDQMLYKLTKERAPAPDGKGGALNKQGSSNAAASESGGSGQTQPTSGSGSSWRERLLGPDADDDDDDDDDRVLNGNVLMVDQLWLWVMQSHTVVSFFPRRESDPIEGPLYQQADLRDSIFNEVNVDLTRRCENAHDLAALAALHAVSVLLDRSSHPDLEVFRIFEEAISVLTERLTSSLKEFRSEGFRDKAFDYEPVDDGARSIRKRHKEEGRRAERENRHNTSALLELRDMEDELQTLLHLFERQSKVLVSMHATYSRPELREHAANGRSFLGEALKRLREHAQQANDMVQRVRATRDDYDKLLQMVQRQAQVDEVRLSRLHADLASAQSRSVMIFTTFTVIFLPLTFFTGLFGMNTREWGGQDNLPLRTIGAIALPSSAFLVLASLVVAFSTSARRFFRWLDRRRRHLARRVCFEVWGPLVIRAADLGGRLRWKGKASEDRDAPRRRRKLETEASDFWQRNRPERDRGYRIPEVNRRRAHVREREA
ncbi:ankyrin repeat protein [Metarhizium album ARSEF 1941]|uniref:Ankyrin repeat protein n=1 Tax=Metarhizium album (strain ARSEF 1941) TaxID=1081103 RepID=A0A0B2WML2_METAS|nr:ankyrin repeat protein [Metarhizium album ARSEF 1941]KHN94939.1 ankyrin repeat protein [Metarhizium album ARSEF 1941]